jgi:hypothetical protein
MFGIKALAFEGVNGVDVKGEGRTIIQRNWSAPFAGFDSGYP